MNRFDIALGKEPSVIPPKTERYDNLIDAPIGSILAVNPEGEAVLSVNYPTYPLIGVKVSMEGSNSILAQAFGMGTVELSAESRIHGY